jgi:uncharacterized protein YutE (UPF0331/DUF86 family)
MVDKDILWAKISSMQRHLERVRAKRDVDLPEFIRDIDRQESILFNLQMAVQNCIDMAAHIVSEEGVGGAGSANELFYLLEEHQFIVPELTEKMVRALGFRNLPVHEYGKVDLEVVFRVCHENVRDLEEFARILSGRFC